MKKRFRLSVNDTVKATAYSNGKLLASLYDSQFTTIEQITSTLIRKIPYFSGKIIEISIHNETKDTSKYLTIKVNK